MASATARAENAAPFLQALQSSYLSALKNRADWLVEALGARSETEFRAIMRAVL